MNTDYRWIGAAALCLASFALAPPARSAGLTLARDGWTTWQVAAVDGAPEWCCWSETSWSDSAGFRAAPSAPCRLDSGRQNYGSRDDATTDVVRIYARTAGGTIDRLRVFSASCPVTTRMPVQDLGTVPADDSARWLSDLAQQRNGTVTRQIEEDVLAALAINRGDIARDSVAGIARTDARVETRKRAVFWLALLRGREGADITSSIMFNDKSADVREHAAFALGQSKSPRAAADLIRLGNTDAADEVRAQAWFWLAHTAAAGSENAIFAALHQEHDSDVRERALFALSRLPGERSTRALISATEDRSLSRDLRKRALFWLSQSDSDAAQAYLEQVLTAN
ncbi:MAG TPA: HEAT repeat domain-containing protein [Steroidobacteraceae bacterium]|nr:HEAT repeat domain-containing protein [Steroidobacteraceae bacterium]